MESTRIVLLALAAYLVVSAYAAPVDKFQPQETEGMRNAFSRGLATFGGAAQKEPETVPAPNPAQTRVYSHYTRGLRALGGGKPRLRDQYRRHNYVPLAPVVVAPEHEISETITPEEAAKLHVPHPPLQYTTDIL